MLKTLILLAAFLGVIVTAPRVGAAEVMIDPAKAAQLRRLEPLTAEKIDVFVEAGQLTAAQGDYVKHNISADGKLILPQAAVAAPDPEPAPPPVARAPDVAPEAPRPAPRAAEQDHGIYADFHYTLPAADQERMRAMIRNFRHGDHAEVGRELRKLRPEVNALVAEAYNDPTDLLVKADLWETIAGPADPDAVIGVLYTYKAAVELAQPVLIPYEKDAGGVSVRRRRSGPDANDGPVERFYTSRELRDLIEKIEGLIAHCEGTTAATALMNIYAQRYDKGEAPMRDSGRDRKRMVEACGGTPKKFDEDEKKTWSSRLSQHDRALIADVLIPYLHGKNDDRSQIARNGLMICLPHGHPHWDEGRGAWERWWESNKAALLAEK